jgi:hypothetical protein
MLMIEDYNRYKDKHGLVQDNNQGLTVGNGLRTTSEAAIAIYRRGMYDADLKDAIESCEMFPGVLGRCPYNNLGQESIDDYAAVITAAKYVESNIVQRMLAHGENNFYNYNNVNQGKFTFKSWLGRFPQLIAHMKIAIGVEPSLLQKLFWVGSILIASRNKPTAQDEWVLSWLLVFNARDETGIIGWARKIWIKSFKKKVPDGIGGVLRNYLQDKNHPNIRYLIGEFGE